ncbi:MPN domain-containing protein-like [Clavelina lepadiformis]|uniref:MPN domain-containing protein-like n=1 Tax=Clavelina lepadiformis TaxID=159417 RepID=UPI0040421487
MDSESTPVSLTAVPTVVSTPLVAPSPNISTANRSELEKTNTHIAKRSISKNDEKELDSNADDTESLDSNSSKKDVSPRYPRNTSRSVTMQTLLQEGVLEPGHAVLSIDYLGQKYCGDLLTTGKILWENSHFASPSSWATHIKKKVNPSKKSGCGWNSVKYKGKKLDKLKSNWVRKNNPSLSTGLSPASNVDDDYANQTQNTYVDNRMMRKILRFADLKQHTNTDPNTMVEYECFNENAGKPQPFTVMVSTSVLLMIDFHCHLTTNEVVGYLGGKYDPVKKCLYLMQTFPCRCKLGDHDNAGSIEQEIANNLMMRGLSRVGWYHSHPTSAALPTLRDIDVQYELQATTNAHPAIGFICAPFDMRDMTRSESAYSAFWVIYPHEHSQDAVSFGMPMKLMYTECPEQTIHPDLLNEMRLLIEFYKHQPDLIIFNKLWNGVMTYLDKIKLCMQRKLSKDQSGAQLMQFVHDLLTSVSPPPAPLAPPAIS